MKHTGTLFILSAIMIFGILAVTLLLLISISVFNKNNGNANTDIIETFEVIHLIEEPTQEFDLSKSFDNYETNVPTSYADFNVTRYNNRLLVYRNINTNVIERVTINYRDINFENYRYSFMGFDHTSTKQSITDQLFDPDYENKIFNSMTYYLGHDKAVTFYFDYDENLSDEYLVEASCFLLDHNNIPLSDIQALDRVFQYYKKESYIHVALEGFEYGEHIIRAYEDYPDRRVTLCFIGVNAITGELSDHILYEIIY